MNKQATPPEKTRKKLLIMTVKKLHFKRGTPSQMLAIKYGGQSVGQFVQECVRDGGRPELKSDIID